MPLYVLILLRQLRIKGLRRGRFPWWDERARYKTSRELRLPRRWVSATGPSNTSMRTFLGINSWHKWRFPRTNSQDRSMWITKNLGTGRKASFDGEFWWRNPCYNFPIQNLVPGVCWYNNYNYSPSKEVPILEGKIRMKRIMGEKKWVIWTSSSIPSLKVALRDEESIIKSAIH